MARLRCADYGFDCGFAAEGAADEVIAEFGAHMEEAHGIEYSRESLMQFIVRQKG